MQSKSILHLPDMAVGLCTETVEFRQTDGSIGTLMGVLNLEDAKTLSMSILLHAYNQAVEQGGFITWLTGEIAPVMDETYETWLIHQWEARREAIHDATQAHWSFD